MTHSLFETEEENKSAQLPSECAWENKGWLLLPQNPWKRDWKPLQVLQIGSTAVEQAICTWDTT